MKWYDPLESTFPKMQQWFRVTLSAIVAISVCLLFYHIILKGMFT